MAGCRNEWRHAGKKKAHPFLREKREVGSGQELAEEFAAGGVGMMGKNETLLFCEERGVTIPGSGEGKRDGRGPDNSAARPAGNRVRKTADCRASLALIRSYAHGSVGARRRERSNVSIKSYSSVKESAGR